MIVYLAVISLGTWYGARRRALQVAVLKVLLMASILGAAMFSIMALQPLVAVPSIVMFLPVLFAPFALWTVSSVVASDDAPEPTPNECWYAAGLVYYNPGDAAVFVEKRDGIGYTLNFGSALAWIFLLGPLLIVGLMGYLFH